MLHLISKVPVIQRFLFHCMRKDIEDAFAKGNTFIVIMAEDYFFRDNKLVNETVAGWDETRPVGHIEINMGHRTYAVFFTGKTLQDLWDGLSFMKNGMGNRWMEFPIRNYMITLKHAAESQGIPLLTDEVYP